MSWTRLDDGFTDRPVFDGLPFEVRWHYLALVQFCSRTSRYDGVIRKADARRCSDVSDPAGAMVLLSGAGLAVVRDDDVVLPLLEEHIPPPSMRDETRKERQRAEKRRSRLHACEDHSECLPERCRKATAPDVSTKVSTDSGLTVSTDVSAAQGAAAVNERRPNGVSPGQRAPRPDVGTNVSTDSGTGRDGSGPEAVIARTHAREDPDRSDATDPAELSTPPPQNAGQKTVSPEHQAPFRSTTNTNDSPTSRCIECGKVSTFSLLDARCRACAGGDRRAS